MMSFRCAVVRAAWVAVLVSGAAYGTAFQNGGFESPVLAGQLSQTERRRLFDHDLRSYDTALGAVRRYETEVVP